MNLKRIAVLAGFAIAVTFVLEFISEALGKALPEKIGKWPLRFIQGAAILAALFATGFAFRKLKLRPPVNV